MQFTVTESDNLATVVAEAGVTDERLTAAVPFLLASAGFGKYPVPFTVEVEVKDGYASLSVQRANGAPYPVEVLTGGRISAEVAAVQGITPEDILSGAVAVPDRPFIDNRTQVIEPASAAPDLTADAGQPGVNA